MGKNIIQYILDTTELKQKDIAEKLEVSTTQISKWKKGEYISYDKRNQLEKLAGIIEYSLEWTESVKTQENSNKWVNYVYNIAEYSETWEELDDTIIIGILRNIVCSGIKLDKTPPQLTSNEESTNFEYFIQSVIENYTILSSFHSKYLYTYDYNEGKINELAMEIGFQLLPWSLNNIDDHILESLNIDMEIFNKNIKKTKHNLINLINNYCKELIIYNKPIIEDYFLLVNTYPPHLDDYLFENNTSIFKYHTLAERRILTELHIIKESLNRK